MPDNPSDEDKAKYLDFKVQGGTDGDDGRKFEARYAAWEMINAACLVKSNQLVSTDILLASQLRCYVNDFWIAIEGDVKRFEMKRGASVGWGEKFKTLRWDFKEQQQVDRADGVRAEYFLVVATRENASSWKRMDLRKSRSCIFPIPAVFWPSTRWLKSSSQR